MKTKFSEISSSLIQYTNEIGVFMYMVAFTWDFKRAKKTLIYTGITNNIFRRKFEHETRTKSNWAKFMNYIFKKKWKYCELVFVGYLPKGKDWSWIEQKTQTFTVKQKKELIDSNNNHVNLILRCVRKGYTYPQLEGMFPILKDNY